MHGMVRVNTKTLLAHLWSLLCFAPPENTENFLVFLGGKEWPEKC